MKRLIKQLFFLPLLITVFASCEKDENQIYYEGGTKPALSADKTGTITISKPTKDLPGVTFSWTNPTYVFNTGISSQDVSYAIEMRVKGSTTAYKTIAVVKKDLTKAFTQEELNTFLTKTPGEGGLGLLPDVAADVEVRVTSFLGASSSTNATNLSSDVMIFTINKPYSVIPDLWVTGEAVASNWTNTPPADQKFVYDAATKTFSITINLAGGKYYKFLTISGQWQPQWGVSAGTTTGLSTFNIVENPGGGSDPDAIQAPAATGNYKIVVDLINKKTTVSL